MADDPSFHVGVDERALEDVLMRVRKVWDLHYRVPVPKLNYMCPVCEKVNLIYRSCHFHVRLNSPTRYRGSVGLKCAHCSYLLNFALVVPRHMFAWRPGAPMDKREIEAALQEGPVYD